MTRIYRIRFDKSSYELDKDYERLSEHEKLAISAINPESFFDFNDTDGKYTIYLAFCPMDMKKYVSILDRNLIWHDSADISDLILEGDAEIDREARAYVNSLNRFKWNSYSKKVEEWIYESLDMDFVLDRISKVGIDNLRQVEKKYLRNYQS